MAKRIIVLGANGMAGHVISIGLRADENNYDVVTVARSNSVINPSVLLDVSDFLGLSKLIKDIRPDVIINCIGLLNKTAEDNPDKAILINSYFPHYLESQTKNTNTKVVHISTDCVFNGDEGSYKENAFKNGRGFYAQSKALGEIDNSKDLTFRTSIIGPELNKNGIGLFHWFVNQEGEINGYTQAYWTGITTIELLKAVKHVLVNEDITGLYHLVNEHKISKYDLVRIFNDVFETDLIIKPYDGYKVDKSLISTRNDFSYKVNSYDSMIKEMKNWINNHREYYAHYNEIINS